MDGSQNPEFLPEAIPILPGHTLIRPATGMLKSAVQFPLKDFESSLVYGNKDNIGIAYGKTNDRTLYSDFRKSNNLLETLVHIIQNSKKTSKPLIIIDSSLIKTPKPKSPLENLIAHAEEENDAREMLDESDPEMSYYYDENGDKIDFRRKKKSRSKYRKRSYEETKDSLDVTSGSSSAEHEKNPGNPYTIHKNKYKQNWLWNHFMDGDHVNLNPYAPEFKNLGPTGADLFFGRKWWYFNQDDYKPMR